MAEFSAGGLIQGGGIPVRICFGEPTSPGDMEYDEDIVCPRCWHVEPLIGWVRGKHECFTGRRFSR